MVGARLRRQQVAYAHGRGLSSRRACALLSVARSTLGYQSRLAVRAAPAIATKNTNEDRSMNPPIIPERLGRFSSDPSA
jgi:hypothetical protein